MKVVPKQFTGSEQKSYNWKKPKSRKSHKKVDRAKINRKFFGPTQNHDSYELP